MKRILIVFLLASAGYVSVAAQSKPIPAGWMEVEACGFSFRVPAELKAQKVRSADPCLAGFTGPEINVWLDFGPYSGPILKQEFMLEHRETQIDLDGRTARLITYRDGRAMNMRSYPFVTEIHLVITTGGSEHLLSLIISTTDKVKPEIAKRVYERLRYTEKYSTSVIAMRVP